LLKQDLFPTAGRAVLAVSGGSDSVALLDLLAGLASELELELVVGHVDHGIASESGDVAKVVAAAAARYGLPFHLAVLQLGRGTSETTARKERYRELRAIQREVGAAYLVTAHHADDQVETVLHRLLKGTGVAGLAGIPARGPRGLVRPLLPFSRAELGAWLRDAGLEDTAHEDPANRDLRHDRSWIRQELLPLLRSRFGPEVERRLTNVGRFARQDRKAWSSALRELGELEYRRGLRGVEVAREPLRRYDNSLTDAMLRALAREVGCLLGPQRAQRLRRFVQSSSSGRVLQLGGGWEAELSFDRLTLVRAQADEDADVIECGVLPEGRATWGAWVFSWRMEPAGCPSRVAYETWVTPGASRVRGAAPGDRIAPLGGVGRRKVRRLLMESRVPFRQRTKHPVLVRDAEVLWIPGVCRSSVAVPRAGDPALKIEARSDSPRREGGS
jgi:tRNA(Ile)-lysidine synthase